MKNFDEWLNEQAPAPAPAPTPAPVPAQAAPIGQPTQPAGAADPLFRQIMTTFQNINTMIAQSPNKTRWTGLLQQSLKDMEMKLKAEPKPQAVQQPVAGQPQTPGQPTAAPVAPAR